MDFKTLPDGPVTLRNVTIPAAVLGQDGDLVRTEIGIADGKIAAAGGAAIDMGGAMVLPAFVDCHTHLDKGHILPRAQNPDGTFIGALSNVRADHANWTSEDVRTRADFSIRCAYAHGTRAIRTHVDSMNGQYARSWPVLAELRDEWAGKIDLQMASLISCEGYALAEYHDIAEAVAQYGGVLGMVSYPIPELKEVLLGHLETAGKLGLALDFHTDETMDPSSETLRLIAECVLETGFDAPVLVGHCCSLSAQDDARALDTLDLVAKAKLDVVSLPMCNLYLQDRQAARTPRGRGVTLVHEMKARGIKVSFASDNTRDPFYAYGDMDMLEVMRMATRIAHLDHSDPDWVQSFAATPATVCGFADNSLAIGAAADLIICSARNWNELYARPQSDRIVLRNGVAIDRTLPSYTELDPLFEATP
ncbi:cytosine deaminase [Yoonia sp. BS5-3]|uniref:Cytosine deaminase n=1 Tax=Yoonia phaeophyticola TaxID=3137369 RepID=A0ABZ2V5Z3_9RHOB